MQVCRFMKTNTPYRQHITTRNHIDARFRGGESLGSLSKSHQPGESSFEQSSSITGNSTQLSRSAASATAGSDLSIPPSLPSSVSAFSDRPFDLRPRYETEGTTAAGLFDHETATSFSDDLQFSLDKTSNPGTSVGSHGNEPFESGRQPPTRLDRFESYINDNMRSYAPIFSALHEDRGTPAAAHDDLASQESIAGRDGMRVVVDLGSRSTIDLEHQVNRLDAADMEYLRAKGEA